MPIYEYRCASCGKFEQTQPITADPLTSCPTCGGPVKRLVARNVNILYKGPGFFVTDYRNSSYKDSKDSEEKFEKDEEAEDGLSEMPA